MCLLSVAICSVEASGPCQPKRVLCSLWEAPTDRLPQQGFPSWFLLNVYIPDLMVFYHLSISFTLVCNMFNKSLIQTKVWLSDHPPNLTGQIPMAVVTPGLLPRGWVVEAKRLVKWALSSGVLSSIPATCSCLLCWFCGRE